MSSKSSTRSLIDHFEAEIAAKIDKEIIITLERNHLNYILYVLFLKRIYSGENNGDPVTLTFKWRELAAVLDFIADDPDEEELRNVLEAALKEGSSL